MADLVNTFNRELSALSVMMMIINAIVHILFASAIAHDAGLLRKRNQSTQLVSGITWAFATLAGGGDCRCDLLGIALLTHGA